jgi:hypothetical protein
MAAMFVNRSDEISNIHRGPSIDASYQVSVQFAKQFQGRRFLEIDQSETRIACDWQPDCSFRPDPLTNVAATGHSFF